MDEPSQGERNKPAALQLELPGPAPVPARAAEPAGRASVRAGERRSAALPIALGATLLVAAGGVVAVEVVLPRYVRTTCIEQAAAHGLVLAIDDVKISRSGFVLTGVKATAADLPGASVEAPEVDVETRGLRPEKLTASGMEIALDGRWSSVSEQFTRWRASERGGQEGAWAPEALVIDGSRIVWRGPIGDNARVEAAGVHLDVTWRDRAPSMHATSSHVTVVVPGGTLGPWRVDIDRDASAARVRVALDPGVPEASTVLVVGNDREITSVDVAVPRSPIARLGLASALLGLHGDLQLAAALHYTPYGPHANANATTRGGLYGVALDGIPHALDVSWEASGNGVADRSAAIGSNGDRASIDIDEGRLAVGPLVGSTRGTVKTYVDGFRVDLAWHAGPVPCAAFDAPLGPGQPFDIAYQIRKLAESAGLARLKGDVSASATLAFDSRDLGATAVTFEPKTTCDLAVGSK